MLRIGCARFVPAWRCQLWQLGQQCGRLLLCVQAWWESGWNSVEGQLFAQVSELEVIHAGLDVYEDLLEVGLLSSELLLAMDFVKARQRAGQIIKVSSCRPTT
jgi:hypothetical protein